MNVITTAVLTACYTICMLILAGAGYDYVYEGYGLHPALSIGACFGLTVGYMAALHALGNKTKEQDYDATNELTWPKLDT